MAASIASSPFTGIEDPLSENGAWVPLTSPGLFPNGGRFQKNNGAFPDKAPPDHAGAHTSAAVPPDHYSQIVVGMLVIGVLGMLSSAFIRLIGVRCMPWLPRHMKDGA